MKWLTAVVIGLFSLGLVLYDILSLYILGVDYTVSAIINEWAFQAHPLLVFLAGFVNGGLVVHFLKWKPR
jgi:hypothetical protein